MKVLKICISYSCPFKCYFCYYKDKLSDTTLLDVKCLDDFLKSNHNKFDKFVITGGEPSLLLNSYLKDVVETIKKYSSNIELETYPIVDGTYFRDFEDININISYDITARSRVQQVWQSILQYKFPFDITVTLSPIVFRFQPNKILQTLNMLPMLRHVKFKPFYNNENFKHTIRKSDYEKFITLLNNSKLNLHYTYEYEQFNDEFVINPNGKLFSVQFIDGNRIEKEINPSEVEDCKTNYPDEVLL